MRVLVPLAAAAAILWSAAANACGCGAIVAPQAPAGRRPAANACGCGAIVAPQEQAGQRIDEWSLVHFDGRAEEILMRLRFGVPLDSAALVLPVRPGASVALGDDTEFDRIDDMT